MFDNPFRLILTVSIGFEFDYTIQSDLRDEVIKLHRDVNILLIHHRSCWGREPSVKRYKTREQHWRSTQLNVARKISDS